MLDSTFADAWYIKGKSLINLNRTEEATEIFEKAISLNPDLPNPLTAKATLFPISGMVLGLILTSIITSRRIQ